MSGYTHRYVADQGIVCDRCGASRGVFGPQPRSWTCDTCGLAAPVDNIDKIPGMAVSPSPKSDPKAGTDDLRREVEQALRLYDHPRWELAAGIIIEMVESRLAAAGRLLPPDAHVITDEYGVKHHGQVEEFGFGTAGAGVAREDIAHHGGRLMRKVHRAYADGSSWVGPWVPVDPPKEGDDDA